MSHLSESQKYTLLRLLKDLASVDRNFNLKEATRIRLIGLRLDLHPEKISEALGEDFEAISKHLKHFEDPAQRKYVYQQCLLLLHSDREFSEEEQKAANEIKETFQLVQSFHEQVVNWVKEGMEWEQRGQELVGESPSSF